MSFKAAASAASQIPLWRRTPGLCSDFGIGSQTLYPPLLDPIQISYYLPLFFQGDYVFGSEDNTTFFVYVYDFQSPLWIIISFSQHPKLDLLQFFITFST
jgi:hypothetical protein